MTHANRQHLITDAVLTIVNDGELYKIREQSNFISVLDRYIQKNFRKAYANDRILIIGKCFKHWNMTPSSDYITQEFIENWESDGILSSVYCFQIISRNNDINGNPYRLIMVHLTNGAVFGFEEKSSMPNFRYKAANVTDMQLMSIHVQPAEYKKIKLDCNKVYSI